MRRQGRVEARGGDIPFVLVFPDSDHEVVNLFLRDLVVSDCSPATIRSYAYDLLRWLRFLKALDVRWDRAERFHVRDLVAEMRVTSTATALRSSDGARPSNSVSGRPAASSTLSAATINHQLTVLRSFYEFTLATGLGPLVNPVPTQLAGRGRVRAHQSPMEPTRPERRARYRQRVMERGWQGIPDVSMATIFGSLRSNRDRAMLSFWLSSGARASELLGMRHGDYDFGEHTFVVTSKGTRARDVLPASPDAFVWLALYMAEEQPSDPGDPVWWTLQGEVRRPLSYAGARAMFARAQRSLGSNWTLHDLRHTAATRMLSDPGMSLVDVQTILRHANVATTSLYTQPRLSDVLHKALEHYSRPPVPLALPDPGYNEGALRELLGLSDE